MPAELQQVECAECGHVFADAVEATRLVDRPTCPICGATARKGSILAQSVIQVTSDTKFVGRSSGGGRPFVKGWLKREWFHRLDRWHRVERIVNRRDDTCDEVITDAETGDVVHECHEPMSEHRGHGSARHRR